MEGNQRTDEMSDDKEGNQRTDEMPDENTAADNPKKEAAPEEEITGPPQSKEMEKSKEESAKHIINDSVEETEIIRYNDSFAGVVVNFLLGFVRMLIFLPTVFHVATLIGYVLQVYMYVRNVCVPIFGGHAY